MFWKVSFFLQNVIIGLSEQCSVMVGYFGTSEGVRAAFIDQLSRMRPR